MEAVTVSGQIRTDVGKKATKAIRNAGEVPAVLYSKEKTIHFATTQKAVKSLIYTPKFKLAEVNVDGNTYRAIVKDIQFDPVTDDIVHLDFLHLIDGHPVKVEVPVRFNGTAPGMRAGGKLLRLMRRIKIKTTPENMVNELSLDITSLELGQSIRVRDIAPVDGVEIMSPSGAPVGIIEVPRALRSAATAEKKAAGKK
ncbi:50S ribosomal protein L25 [Lewinella sp. LCG006]|uniref:50S ribosomal protein L25 n=1 Tax=Lewinella sp. LCG006 TaxID=3231911 RepID=UPI00345F86A5